MTLSLVLLFGGFVVGAIDSRMALLAARGGMAAQLAARPFLLVLLGGLATPALFALLAGGFFALTWYVWLGVVIAWLLAVGLIVNANTFHVFYRISPFLNVVTIAAAVAFWGDYFGLINLN